MVIDGKKIAQEILGRVKSSEHFEEVRKAKFMAAILVGDDKSSVSFLAQKEKVAKQLGIDFRLYRFPADIKNDALREEVGKIAKHKTCGGVIVQLPLLEHLNWYYILNAIPPEKDVDVLSERMLGAFYVGRGRVSPPAVETVETILGAAGVTSKAGDTTASLTSKSVAIVGLGLLVGRPVANWIMRRAKETFLLRRTSDFGILKQADIVITGVGRAGLIKPEMLKAGAGIIDFGYENGNGDFDADHLAKDDAGIAFYTPTPGGTGPILVAKLFENFYFLNKSEKIDELT
jgi:methylenetetrahydrofolate dehydrogenase (NADP+)/methenyltetrahydrofolate cyclohydrolase